MKKKMADHLPHRVQPAKKWRNTRNIRLRDEKVQQREQEPREEVIMQNQPIWAEGARRRVARGLSRAQPREYYDVPVFVVYTPNTAKSGQVPLYPRVPNILMMGLQRFSHIW